MIKYKVEKRDRKTNQWEKVGFVKVNENQKMTNTFEDRYTLIPPPNYDRMISIGALIISLIALVIQFG